MRIVYQIMFLFMFSMTLAIHEDCEIESSETIKSDKICTCITSQYTSLTGELQTFKEKLSNSEKELELVTKKLKVYYEDFVTFNCEINESPQLCVIKNLKVDEEKIKVIEVLIPESLLLSIDDLTELEILHSNIKFIPKNIFNIMPDLEALTIIQSALKTITRGSFKGAKKIESITIEGNIIPDLGPHIFEGAETVLHLFLSQNRINTVDPDTFKGLKHLKVLSLRNNNIKELNINVFKDIVQLQKLTVSYNKLETVDDHLLKNNRELIYLKFDQNYLSESSDHSNLTQYASKKLKADFSNQKKISKTGDEVEEDRDIKSRV